MSEPIPAYPARDVARLIASDRALLRDYAAGCQSGAVEPVTDRGKHYVAVHDPALSRRLEAAGRPLVRHHYDADSGSVAAAS